MKFISTLKAERSIAQLLAERDLQGPEARKVIESLRRVGPTAIPKLIDAFVTADKEHASALVQTLSSYVSNETLKEITTGLGHSNARCVAGVAAALAASSNYDPNNLLEFLGRDDISASALVEVLRSSKQRLNPR